MNAVEVGLLLDHLATAYNRPVDQDFVGIWHNQLSGVPADVAMDAAENLIGTSEFFPTLAAFHREVAAIHRDRAKDRREALAAPTGCSCLSGWVLGDDDYVSPCRRCHDGSERAECEEKYRGQRARQRRRIVGPEFLSERPADPASAAEWAEAARADLEAAR